MQKLSVLLASGLFVMGVIPAFAEIGCENEKCPSGFALKTACPPAQPSDGGQSVSCKGQKAVCEKIIVDSEGHQQSGEQKRVKCYIQGHVPTTAKPSSSSLYEDPLAFIEELE